MAGNEQPAWLPMSAAPRDGTEIVIRARGVGVVAARYVDCAWLREDFTLNNGITVPGDPSVTDCWRTIREKDIELSDATGWR